MTKVEAKNTRNHYIITAKGHADDPKVCAGISALMYALAGSLLNHDNGVKIGLMKLDSGDAEIDFIAQNPKAREDFKCIVIGLLQIELEYREHISVQQNIL